jgi:hypothetical protein
MIEIWVEPPEKLKSHDDDQTEHSSCGGIWRGVSMQRHCEYCMHKDNRDDKNAKKKKNRRESLWRRIEVCARRQSTGVEMDSRGMVH